MPSLKDFLAAVPGASCSVAAESVRFQSVSTDSRSIGSGGLFVALVGPNFDGHNFLADVQKKGAVAAVVSRPDLLQSVPGLAMVQVPDT